MLRDGEITLEKARVVRFDERRPCAIAVPALRNFSPADLTYLDLAIERFWGLTGREVSDNSHGAAWATRANGDAMPYELSYFDDSPLGSNTKSKLLKLATTKNLRSR